MDRGLSNPRISSKYELYYGNRYTFKSCLSNWGVHLSGSGRGIIGDFRQRRICFRRCRIWRFHRRVSIILPYANDLF